MGKLQDMGESLYQFYYSDELILMDGEKIIFLEVTQFESLFLFTDDIKFIVDFFNKMIKI